MSMTPGDLEQAIAHFERDPRSLGDCIRAARMAQVAGDDALALRLTGRYAEAHGITDQAPVALASFARQAPVRTFADRALLAVEGEDADTLYVLLRGEVVVRRDGVGELARLGPGRFLGEVSALFDVHRTATAEARGPVTAMVLPAVALKKLARYVPPVSAWLALTARDRLLPYLMGPDTMLGVLSREEQLGIFRRSKPFSVSPGQVLQSNGQVLERVHLMLSGRCSAWRNGLSGQKHVLPEVVPGDAVGLVDLVMGEFAHISVTAITPVSGFSVRVAYVHQALEKHPSIRARMRDLLPDPGAGARPSAGLEVSHSIAEASTELTVEERASFITHRGGRACRVCGFPDADLQCPACGANT